jgi:sec-independent protein translocase protein TatB
MFDIGWMELLLIGIVALIVVGPKDLPKLFRTVGNVMGKARGMAREFQRSMEQAADESGLREATRDLNSINKLNLNAPTKSARKYAEGLVTGAKRGDAADGRADKVAEKVAGKGKAVPPGPGGGAGESAALRPVAGDASRPAGEAAPAGDGGGGAAAGGGDGG